MYRYLLTVVLIVASLLTGTRSFASVVVCVPKDVNALPLPDGTGAGPTPKHIGSDDCLGKAIYGAMTRSLTKARYENTVVVYFQDSNNSSQKTLSDAGFTSVTVTIGSTPHDFTLVSHEGGEPDWYFFRFTITKKDFPDAQHGDLIRVQVHAKEVPDAPLDLDFVAPLTLYGVGGSHLGFWFPIALFSTDFQSNTKGITFAPMPIGLAFGAKWNATNGFYLGGSLIGNWLIAPAKNALGVATGNYSAAGITAGALVDVNNWVYLGYAYGFDLTSAHQNPGNLFVLGAAPGLLQLLQGKP